MSMPAKQDGAPRIDQFYGNHERYANNWREKFADHYHPLLREGMTILDVGSGRAPAIPIEHRPADCHYIGLDISATELAMAPTGSYDETYARDLRVHEPDLDDRIELVISWQVLEHIEPLSNAIENVHAYLKPGCHFVALLSGRNAHFAVINRLIPERIGILAMERLLKRPPDTIFRAHYDACLYSGLMALFTTWSSIDVVSHFRGAEYLGFSPLLTRLYLRYEDWAVRTRRLNLATHYAVLARR